MVMRVLAFFLVTVSASTQVWSMDIAQFDRRQKIVPLANGVRMAVVETGNPKGPAIVMIHGYTNNSVEWVDFLPNLSPNMRILLVDLRGHGASSKPECCYTRVDFAYDIKLLLDRLKIERADIFGQSLGSIVAQTFAEYWPQRTRRVILMSSTGGPGEVPDAVNSMRSAIASLKDPIDPDSPFMLAWWDAPGFNAVLLRRIRVDSARIPADVWRAMLDQGLVFNDLQASLPRLKAPTLLIWGGKDTIFGPDDRRSLQDALPQARTVLYEDSGHYPFWDHPKEVADEINRFLQ